MQRLQGVAFMAFAALGNYSIKSCIGCECTYCSGTKWQPPTGTVKFYSSVHDKFSVESSRLNIEEGLDFKPSPGWGTEPVKLYICIDYIWIILTNKILFLYLKKYFICWVRTVKYYLHLGAELEILLVLAWIIPNN